MKYNIILLYILFALIILIIVIYNTNRLKDESSVSSSVEVYNDNIKTSNEVSNETSNEVSITESFPSSQEKKIDLLNKIPLISLAYTHENAPLTYRKEREERTGWEEREEREEREGTQPLTFRNYEDQTQPLTYRREREERQNIQDLQDIPLTYPDNIDYNTYYNAESLNYPSDSLDYLILPENTDHPELLTARAPISLDESIEESLEDNLKDNLKDRLKDGLSDIFSQVQTSYSSYLLSKKSYFNSRKKFKESYLITDDRLKKNNIFKEALDEAHDSSLFANETYRNCNKVFDMILKLPTQKEMVDAKIYFDNATEYSNKVKKYADFSHKIIVN